MPVIFSQIVIYITAKCQVHVTYVHVLSHYNGGSRLPDHKKSVLSSPARSIQVYLVLDQLIRGTYISDKSIAER